MHMTNRQYRGSRIPRIVRRAAQWPSWAQKSTLVRSTAKPPFSARLSPGSPSVSLQGMWDSEGYGEANLAAFIPFELQRDLINVESNLLLNATSGTANATFNGLTNTAGTLTRA